MTDLHKDEMLLLVRKIETNISTIIWLLVVLSIWMGLIIGLLITM